MTPDMAIVGAGLSGLACALQLAQLGYKVSVYERRSHLEIVAPRYMLRGKAGRSMSMDLSKRGLHTLKEVGIVENVLKKSIPMEKKIYHKSSGKILSVPYGRNKHEYVITTSRTHLYTCLLKECLKHANIEIKFSHKLLEIDFDYKVASFYNTMKKEYVHTAPHLIIGADGVNSKSRSLMCYKYKGTIPFKLSIFPQCYKELTISKENSQKLVHTAMHVWPRNGFMLVAQPNFNGSFTCALIMKPTGGSHSFASLNSDTKIRKFFTEHFETASRLMPELEQENKYNPVCPLKFLQGSTYIANNFLVLIGDAAHGMLPFFGQGVNCAFEDTTILRNCILNAKGKLVSAIQEYNEQRVKDANAICTMSYENYPELLKNSDIDRLLLEKQIDSLIANKFQEKYRTYHNLVCFDRVPYSYAQKIKEFQITMLHRICKNITNVEDVDYSIINQELNFYNQKIENFHRTQYEY